MLPHLFPILAAFLIPLANYSLADSLSSKKRNKQKQFVICRQVPDTTAMKKKPKVSAQMIELGTRGGMRTKRRVHKVKINGKIVELQGKEYYSYIAGLSHRRNNPAAKRSGYENGGRRPKDSSATQ